MNGHPSQFPADPHAVGKTARFTRFLVSGGTLALEVAAAVGISDTTKLKSPELIELEGGIASVEAIHAGRIRQAFNALGVKIPVVPNAVMNTSSRSEWVIKV